MSGPLAAGDHEVGILLAASEHGNPNQLENTRCYGDDENDPDAVARAVIVELRE